MRVFNTLTRAKEPFAPAHPPALSMYVCGPTVYDLSHLGHARCYAAFDTIVRWLRASGYAVKYVRNFTDVDDKIIKRAHERGEDPAELAERNIADFHADMGALGIARADVEPRVTTHIPQIVKIVETLIAGGHAYVVGGAGAGDVYFDVTTFPKYLQLSRQDPEELRAGARVAAVEGLRNPEDFALWKAAKPGEPSWESPWGPGRPGWHIECSAMSAEHLGKNFDIHGGGKDLVFPHHENEIAQTEAATGVPCARVWLHNGFVNIDSQKMAKSLGNFFTVREVLGRYDAEAMRRFLLSVHYRSDINLDVQLVEEGAPPRFPDIEQAERRVAYGYETLVKAGEFLAAGGVGTGGGGVGADRTPAPPDDAFRAGMDDDFNTAVALAVLETEIFQPINELADGGGKHKKTPLADRRSTVARLREDAVRLGAVLGLFQRSPSQAVLEIRTRAARRLGIDELKVAGLIADRLAARKSKDYARADAIRAELATLGVELRDRPGGTTDWAIAAPAAAAPAG